MRKRPILKFQVTYLNSDCSLHIYGTAKKQIKVAIFIMIMLVTVMRRICY